MNRHVALQSTNRGFDLIGRWQHSTLSSDEYLQLGFVTCPATQFLSVDLVYLFSAKHGGVAVGAFSVLEVEDCLLRYCNLPNCEYIATTVQCA